MSYLFPPIFWLQMLYFWICVFLAFYIPGNIFFKKENLDKLTNLVVSIGMGMVLWGFQGLVFGYLHIRWMSYVYILLVSIFWLKKSFPFKFSNPVKVVFSRKNLVPIFLIVIGCFMQLATIWFTGVSTNKGDYYCCGDARDNILHIAIAKSIVQSVPPLEPGLSGVVIKNYHYFSSLIVGELVRVFHLPLIATDYQFMTILIVLLLGLSLVSLGKILFLPQPLTNWIIFFYYFGGDLVFGLVFLMTRKLSFDMSSLEDGSKFLANYPRAFGIDELIVGLILLVLFLKNKKSKLLGILLAIVMGSLISLKVYVGIFAMVGLITLVGFQMLRKNFSLLPYACLALLISVALYLPVNAGAGGLYFTGFWLFENYISQSGFHLIRWELARTIYQQHNSYLRVLSYELLYMLIYCVTIFGTKLLGIFQTRRSLKIFPVELHIFLLSGLIVSFIAGLFFQQGAGSGANTFNFLVSVFILGSFYTALAVWYWLAKLPKKVAVFLAFVIISLTIPRIIYETYRNLNRIIHFEGVYVPINQLQTFEYMNNKIPSGSIVLVDQRLSFGFDREISYVALYTNNQMYLSGQGDELDAHGINYKKRQKLADLVKSNNRCINASLLNTSSIMYILTDESSFFDSSRSAEFVTKEFQNGTIQLLKVNKTNTEKFLKEIKQNPKINCME